MRAADQQSGFTLTELIMVIVILGILSAVAMPMWFSRAAFDERGYFDEMIQAARYAQKIAITSNCNVAFTVTSTSFSLAIQNVPSSHCENIELFLPGKSEHASAPSGVTASPANVVFYPDNRANNNTTITIGSHSMYIYSSTAFVERL